MNFLVAESSMNSYEEFGNNIENIPAKWRDRCMLLVAAGGCVDAVSIEGIGRTFVYAEGTVVYIALF